MKPNILMQPDHWSSSIHQIPWLLINKIDQRNSGGTLRQKEKKEKEKKEKKEEKEKKEKKEEKERREEKRRAEKREKLREKERKRYPGVKYHQSAFNS